MGQFINPDCNTWKASRPSPHWYFMAVHKSRPSSTTIAATTALKINTAATVAAHLLFGEMKPSGEGAASQKMMICDQLYSVYVSISVF